MLHIRVLGLVLALAVSGALTLPAFAQNASSALVEGFRSAKFGTDERAVRAAIKADFGLDAKAVSAEENPIEKTTALVATVETLEPGGKAQIAYILGYKSKKLIQVNVVWGAPVDPGITAEKLTGTAVLLRNYFTQQPFAPDRRQQDQRLQDGSIVFFQGTDAQDRQVSLHLLGVPLSTKEGEKPKVGYSLRLSYVADPKSPDIPTQGGVILTEDRSQKTEVSGSVSNLTSDFWLLDTLDVVSDDSYYPRAFEGGWW